MPIKRKKTNIHCCEIKLLKWLFLHRDFSLSMFGNCSYSVTKYSNCYFLHGSREHYAFLSTDDLSLTWVFIRDLMLFMIIMEWTCIYWCLYLLIYFIQEGFKIWYMPTYFLINNLLLMKPPDYVLLCGEQKMCFSLPSLVDWMQWENGKSIAKASRIW